MIPFGISFDGFVPITEAMEIAKVAEACGARSFWIAEHLGYREPFITALALAQATKTARLFPTAVSPYLRHPMPTAMALASLAEIMPNRFGAAIGVGNPLFLKESGLAIEKPVKVIEQYVTALRGLMDGATVNQEGLTFHLAGARLAFKPEPSPPIYLAAIGPQMLKLAGRIADGLVLSSGLTIPYVKQSLEIATKAARESGRNLTTLHKTSYIFFIAGGNAEDRNAKVRQKLAFLFRNQKISDNLRSSGLSIDHEAIMAAVARRDHAQAMALVPDQAVDAFAVAGEPDECRRRLQSYADAGLDEVILSLVGTTEDRVRSIRIMRSL